MPKIVKEIITSFSFFFFLLFFCTESLISGISFTLLGPSDFGLARRGELGGRAWLAASMPGRGKPVWATISIPLHIFAVCPLPLPPLPRGFTAASRSVVTQPKVPETRHFGCGRDFIEVLVNSRS